MTYSTRFLFVVAFVSSLSCASFGAFGADNTQDTARGGGEEPSTFGRNMVFLGLGFGTVVFDTACVFVPPDALGPHDQCVVIRPAPAATTFEFLNLGSIYIPPDSTRSIILPTLIYNIKYHFNNTTAVPENAKFSLRTPVTIESDVLKDPTLIDPATGLPYNGKFDTSVNVAYSTSRTLAVGEQMDEKMRFSGVGIQAWDTELFLGSNIPAKVIGKMFESPMTIRFGLSGTVKLVDRASIIFGLRLVGDQ